MLNFFNLFLQVESYKMPLRIKVKQFHVQFCLLQDYSILNSERGLLRTLGNKNGGQFVVS